MAILSAGKLHAHIKFGQESYLPGQLVTGEVILDALKPLEYKTIRVVGLGEVVTYIQTNDNYKVKYFHGRLNAREIPAYTTHDIPIIKEVPLAGMAAGQNGPPVLPPGQHAFGFAFQLPLGIPDSMEMFSSMTGVSVDYVIRLHVDVPGFFSSNMEYQEVFMVRTPYYGPYPPISRSMADLKVTRLCCISSGFLAVTMHADRCVVGIKQPIQVQVDIDARGLTTPLAEKKPLIVALQVNVEVRSAWHNISNYSERVARSEIRQPLMPGQVYSLRTVVNVALPRQTPSSSSSIHDVAYELVLLIPGGPRVSLPITVVSEALEPQTVNYVATIPDDQQLSQQTYDFTTPAPSYEQLTSIPAPLCSVKTTDAK